MKIAIVGTTRAREEGSERKGRGRIAQEFELKVAWEDKGTTRSEAQSPYQSVPISPPYGARYLE